MKAFIAFLLMSIFAFSDQTAFSTTKENKYIYYHSHTATPQELSLASRYCPIFEIDLAWAHTSFHPKVLKNHPYIGHPEEYYTKGGNRFPEGNISLEEFQQFLKENPSVKVLIDVKDMAAFDYLESFVKAIGSNRCIVHAAIQNWRIIPSDVSMESHWHREDIELFALDDLLTRLQVPLIANCRGFSDEHVEKNALLQIMINDAKKCKSVIALGFYYPGVPLPKIEYLEKINEAGYFAWVNGNIDDFEKKLRNLRFIAMSDIMERCTRF